MGIIGIVKNMKKDICAISWIEINRLDDKKIVVEFQVFDEAPKESQGCALERFAAGCTVKS